MSILSYILLSVLLVSSVSLIGAFFLLRSQILERFMPWLVAFAAGTILAVTFFDLVPESLAALDHIAFFYIVGGILLFLLFEQVLHWHHQGHVHDCANCPQTLPVGYSVLLVDGLHNFIDGILIASAFLLDVNIGIATTAAVLLHEVPQEIGDFAVLIHSGFKKSQALWLNLLSALTAFVGALLAYFILQPLEQAIPYIIAVGAGGFLYIALVDLLSEFKGGKSLVLRLSQLLAVIAGIAVLLLLHGSH